MKRKHLKTLGVLISVFMTCTTAYAKGNTKLESYEKAKDISMKEIYHDHRKTFYCEASFDKNKNITLPQGFTSEKQGARLYRVEFEHIVPAENFGRAFKEWREGDKVCVDSKGKSYKGRKCAVKASKEFRFMYADLYNLYPAIGLVNATRSNYNFTVLDKNVPSAFGICQFKIEGRRVEPPEHTRGIIARTYLYMDKEYKKYSMSDQQKQLMNAWNKMYPPTQWECQRAKRIASIQGNINSFTDNLCE